VCEASPSKKEQPLAFVPSATSRFAQQSNPNSKDIMAKLYHIGDLERRQRALEEELSKALLQYSIDDLMIADLKQRIFHLRDEINRFRHEAAGNSVLH
jgi:hypothetical protein